MVNAAREAAALTGIPRSTIHELRTPLTSIRGYAQLLLWGVRSAEQAQRACETILRESEHMTLMLDQLSRVAEARLAQPKKEFPRLDLAKVTQAAVNEARTRWPEHTIIHRNGQVTEVVADPRDLGDVLSILLDNAARYSGPPSVVEAFSRPEGSEARVAVRDEGIGVPSEELEAIFECFRRASNVDKAGPAACRGLGINLFLARVAAAQAGGRLWAESELNKGSTFYLALPLAA